ncbi:MAG: methionine adenosyltransferase [Candidatus Marinimicrobia bacterium]|jgi:S-adenosylmethionine synthetase|nr:methionine adenosyltransferase [Candidatus Neomarinimicrobiota bacterium]MDP6593690.1 methionine adenosyltransferase [Candidatus Neomarinimicrobiota bacterium]MDP6836367.1 methionine adenosyltransferase [Candidatus Neomarinimicrobiota bacterium]|tara:strand:- start:17574 stop:18734 length:1161 start_codon:yes stop_codon:yes gene_type:complete
MKSRLFTSESVTEGHPDKMCDQISDAILDDIIGQDPDARVACETLTTTGLVLVAGEISTNCYSDIPKVIRKTLEDIGYTNPEYGLDYQDCSVLTSIHEQSENIAVGVDESDEHEQGAGDQGLMFGYACNETDVLMPLPIHLAHRVARRLADVRKDGTLPWVRPDGKSQVSVRYEDSRPVGVEKIVVAIQHDPDVSNDVIHSAIREKVIKPVCGDWYQDDTDCFINSTGIFEKGGPEADTGVTGRKIIVDTYGGYGRHGGGAFSGKDPSKVDRSASYMARYIAKNIVAAELAERCEIQLAYTIGRAEPVSVYVDSFGTGKLSDDKLEKIVNDNFPLTPKEIISYLDLKQPIYKATAAYGHFGREEKSFTWEKTDKAEELRQYMNGGN